MKKIRMIATGGALLVVLLNPAPTPAGAGILFGSGHATSDHGVGHRSGHGVGHRSGHGVGHRSGRGFGHRSGRGIGHRSGHRFGYGARRHYGHRHGLGNYSYRAYRHYGRGHQYQTYPGRRYNHSYQSYPGDRHAYADAYSDDHGYQGEGRNGGGDPWALLAGGQAYPALRAFAAAARARPNDGDAKTGYALAAALNGDLSTGEWAMRRALRADPYGFQHIKLNPDLRPSLEALYLRYQGYGQRRYPDLAWFMQAALAYLMNDHDNARRAIAAASAAGDDDASTVNLQMLLATRAAKPASAQRSGDY